MKDFMFNDDELDKEFKKINILIAGGIALSLALTWLFWYSTISVVEQSGGVRELIVSVGKEIKSIAKDISEE